jgi:site-specific recombinase XerD
VARNRARKLPVFLNPEEADRLVAAAKTPRDRVLLQVMLYLGLRVAELVALRSERVNLAGRQVLVYQGKGGKDRMLPIGARLEPVLREWLAGRPPGLLFESGRKVGHSLTTRAVRYIVEGCARRAGISRPDPTQRISPHKLRHTFACRLLHRGVDIVTVKDLMGHSSINTTAVYLHCDTSRLQSAVDRL